LWRKLGNWLLGRHAFKASRQRKFQNLKRDEGDAPCYASESSLRGGLTRAKIYSAIVSMSSSGKTGTPASSTSKSAAMARMEGSSGASGLLCDAPRLRTSSFACGSSLKPLKRMISAPSRCRTSSASVSSAPHNFGQDRKALRRRDDDRLGACITILKGILGVGIDIEGVGRA
jgi:hypothetical protein